MHVKSQLFALENFHLYEKQNQSFVDWNLFELQIEYSCYRYLKLQSHNLC
jgi:hypothetical protein